MRINRLLLTLGLVAATAISAGAERAEEEAPARHPQRRLHPRFPRRRRGRAERTRPEERLRRHLLALHRRPGREGEVQDEEGRTGSHDDGIEKYGADYRARTGKTVEKEHCGRINKETLSKFYAVLFFTTGNPTTKAELKDLIEWTRAGGAFTATHCGSDTLYDTDYGAFVGGYFKTHPPITTVKVKIEDPKHPAAAGFTNGQPYKDEIYIYRDEPYSRDKLHIIFSCEDGSFKPNANQAPRTTTTPSRGARKRARARSSTPPSAT